MIKMKIIENYKNFDIRQSKTGKLFVYSDRDLSWYEDVKFTHSFETVEAARAAIERYWKQK
jgi:hypothetical protein